MSNILIITGVILLIVVLLLIFRVQKLLSVLKDTDRQPVDNSNKINAILCMVFMIGGIILFFWYSNVAQEHYLPVSASEHGVLTDYMFNLTMIIITIAFLITNVLLFYFAYRYQYSADRKATFFSHSNKLEVIWTIVPAIVLATLIFNGWKVWTEITDPAPEDAIAIEIKGKQFAWQVRYGGKDQEIGAYDFRKIDNTNTFGMDFRDRANFDDFTPPAMHIPKGQSVLLKIRAVDVLHSVYAPHFRLKMDAVPGMPTRFHFVPKYTTQEMRDITGNPDFNYEIACAEVCGRGHFAMRLLVIVDEPEDYQKWFNEQKPFLSSNPEYISEVPSDMKELALEVTDQKSETRIDADEASL